LHVLALRRVLAPALEKSSARPRSEALRFLPQSALEYAAAQSLGPRPEEVYLQLISHFGRKRSARFVQHPGLPDMSEVLNNPEASSVLLHRKDVMVRYSFSASTLHRWLRKGLLPPPIRFTGPLWRLADLEAAERAGQVQRTVSA
jgi:predicted DNA-binding transcriptional regulator AlpA